MFYGDAMSVKPVPSPRRRRMSSAERHVQIISAAREAFLEAGFSGTRTRDIAQRAGITEAFLYRHFESKEQIYREAVEAPLARLAEDLVTEVKALSQDGAVKRAQLLERANSVLLQAMVDMAPLLAVALFADLSKGKELYQGTIRPLLREAIELIVTDISGWDPPRVDVDVIVLSFFGLHYGVAIDGILCERTVDVADTARQITAIFAGGVQERPRRGMSRRASAAR